VKITFDWEEAELPAETGNFCVLKMLSPKRSEEDSRWEIISSSPPEVEDQWMTFEVTLEEDEDNEDKNKLFIALALKADDPKCKECEEKATEGSKRAV
jgi:hypothetical protein